MGEPTGDVAFSTNPAFCSSSVSGCVPEIGVKLILLHDAGDVGFAHLVTSTICVQVGVCGLRG